MSTAAKFLCRAIVVLALQAASWAAFAGPLDLLRSPVSAPGDSLSVVLSVGDAAALGVSQLESLDVEVRYDAGSLAFVRARPGNVFPPGAGAPVVLVNDSVPGTLIGGLSTSSGAVPLANGSGLLVLEFRVLAAASDLGNLSVTSVDVDIDESAAVFTLGGPGLLDGDADGLNDAWESLNGLDPGDAADAALDPDLDGVSTLDEVLAGSNPNDQGSVPGPPYLAGDLPGSWDMYTYSDDASLANAPFVQHCFIELDSGGASTAASGCEDPDFPLAGLAAGDLLFTLSASGEVGIDGPGVSLGAGEAATTDAHMDIGRTVIARMDRLAIDGLPGEQALNVFIERGSGYRQNDLEGNWHLFQYGDNVEPGVDNSFWVRFLLNFDASGDLQPNSVFFEGRDPELPVPFSGSAAVSADGTVRTAGEPWAVPATYERMDAGKTVIAGARRESFDDGALLDDSLRVWLKQGEAYSQADAEGVWHMYLIGDAQDAQDPLVSKLTLVVNADGAVVAELGAFAFSATLAVGDAGSAPGLVTLGGDLGSLFTYQHLRMDAGKTVIAGVLDEGEATDRFPSLLVGVKSVAAPPKLVFPAPGSVLADTAATFAWTSNGTAVEAWMLTVGTTPGGTDILDSGELPAEILSTTVNGLPIAGEDVYVRLSYRVDGTYAATDYRYTAVTVRSPELTAPAPGAVLADTTASFAWTANGREVEAWWLYVGTTPDGHELVDSGQLAPGELSRAVSGLPASGERLYVDLWYREGGQWTRTSVQLTAASLPPPALSAPASGSSLASAEATFEWTANGRAVGAWWLYVGTTPNGREIHDSGQLAGDVLARVVSGLPTRGEKLYVDLWYREAGQWTRTSVQLTAADLPPPPAPELSAPAPGSTLTAAEATFEWIANGRTIGAWWLYVGTTLNGREIHDSGQIAGDALSRLVSGLPTRGETLYVNLWYREAGQWTRTSWQLTAADLPPPPPPELTVPAPGSTLAAAEETFAWSANGRTVGAWWLYVGTTPNGREIHDSGLLAGDVLSRLVPGLPTRGETLYVDLWYREAGQWTRTSWQLTAADLPPPPPPELTVPAPGSTLAAAEATFEWIANGRTVGAWWLYVGTTPDGHEIHDSGLLAGNVLSRVVSGLPTRGETLYVDLWYREAGQWTRTSVQLTAADLPPPPAPELTAPAPGSTLASAEATFEWTSNGRAVQAWWLYVGTTPDGHEIFDSGQLGPAQLSRTVSGLPADGERLFVDLWYREGGQWTRTSVQLTAASLPPPALTAPLPESVLSGPQATFEWTANGHAVTAWWLYLGSAPNGREILDSGLMSGDQTSRPVSGLPQDGRPLYADLWRQTGGRWQRSSYRFTADLNLAGSYSVSGSQTDSACTDPADDGTFSFTGTLSIPDHPDNGYVGILTFATVNGAALAPLGLSVETVFNATLDGSDVSSGTFRLEGQESGVPVVVSQGTYQANSAGRTVSVSYQGRDTVGDTCNNSGRFTATR